MKNGTQLCTRIWQVYGQGGTYYGVPDLIPQRFKDYRVALDPDGFFMNDYTHHLLEGEPFHYKPFAYRDTLWVTLVVLTILSPCLRVEDRKVLLGRVCVLLSWIALLVHDNYMDGDHIHGKDHYDMCLCGETYVLFTLFVYNCDCGRCYYKVDNVRPLPWSGDHRTGGTRRI